MNFMTSADFEKLLPSICDKETSQDPDGWTPENPLWGHCAAASLIGQNLFGGELLRASLEGTPYAAMRSHYRNQMQDSTASQFRLGYPDGLAFEVKARNYVLYDPQTHQPREIMARYKLLALRFAQKLNPGNLIFRDPFYKRCFYAALESPCQKMWFGSLIVRDGEIVYEGCNKKIEPLRSMCEPKCIRFSIQSRTESVLGACGHAEEFGLWDVVARRIPLDECELYVAGLYANGLPWLKEEAVHTCLRCSVPMFLSQLKRIYVPVQDRWVGISGEQALETARAYSMQEKKV